MFHRVLRVAPIHFTPKWRRQSYLLRMFSVRATDYTIACICPMGIELAPVEAILDKIHENPSIRSNRNAYTLGQVGDHNVVIAVMPEIGNNAAASVATQLLNDFPQIQFSLLVGIGGGVPGDIDIRLGDVVVSQPTETFGGVVQYDLGKRTTGGAFERTGMLNKPPASLTAHVRKLQAKHLRSGHNLVAVMADMLQKYPKMQATYSFPEGEQDRLFLSSYEYSDGSHDPQNLVARAPRADSMPMIHYGTIGSANVVIKDARVRDQLRQDMKILCVEMEAAGIMNDFPCLVIRGICDYADSHKNKRWQPYAAAVAAAYTKELLMEIPALKVTESTTSAFRKGSHLANAPTIDSTLFIGRKHELESIHDALKPDGGRKELVLGGIGGIGKTQLSLAYARMHAQSYDSIFWLDASSEVAMQSSLSSIARAVGESTDEHLVNRALQWLSQSGNSKWLLICDNYDNPEHFSLRKYLPTASHGAVIVTTRVPDQVGDHQIPVSPLKSIEESLQVLETRSGRPNLHLDQDARRLAERLQGLPLALATAGVYLRKSTWTFEKYLHEYESRWNVNPRKPLQLREYHDRTLYTTWDLSFKRLENEDPDAAKMLKFLAYFDPQVFWFELFREFARDQHVPEWLQSITKDSASFDNVMWVLTDYGFVECQQEYYSMHPCIHDWTVGSLNKDVDLWSCRFVFTGVARVASIIDPSTLGHLSYLPLYQHALRLTGNLYDTIWATLSIDDFSQADDITFFLQSQAKSYPLTILEKVLTQKQQLLGPKDPSTLLTSINLAHHYLNRAQVDLSREMYSQAVNDRGVLYDWQHPRSNQALLQLALLGFYLNDFVLSRALLERSLSKPYDNLLDRSINLHAVNNLAVLCIEEGGYAEAESLCEPFLALCEEQLGLDNPQTLLLMTNLGNCYRQLKKFDQAEQLLLRAINSASRVLGDASACTRYANYHLAEVYFATGDITKGISYHNNALIYLEQALQDDDAEFLTLANRVCQSYLDHDLLEQADQVSLVIFERSRALVGVQAGSTIKALFNHARLRCLQGRFSDAELLFDTALTSCNDFARVWEIKAWQAQVYHFQHREEESDKLLEHVYTECESQLPERHLTRIKIFDKLAQGYQLRSNFQRAEELYLKALSESNDEVNTMSRIVKNLSGLYQELGKQEELDELLSKYPSAAESVNAVEPEN